MNVITSNRQASNKYYTWHEQRPIDLERDGCELATWKDQQGRALFAQHPEGFLVFLPPEKLDVNDEYRVSDPYAAAEKSEFHNRRTDCTLELLKAAVSLLDEKPRILDLGCGEGHITAEMHKLWPNAEISGLDYSISAIRYANAHFRGIDFVVGNAYDSPYSEGYFNIVVCNNLWEHVPDPLVLLNRISLVLSQGGFLIISTPSRYRWSNLLNVIKGRPIEFMSEHHVTEYSVGQVIEQLRFCGYKLVKTYSRSLGSEPLKLKLIQRLFSLFVSVSGSHHQLESTVFYLARRQKGKAG
jgi:2-polyprenyl-3-methyl-5-hydroxy-6-metoxy-1,4-benzoquinol methylase